MPVVHSVQDILHPEQAAEIPTANLETWHSHKKKSTPNTWLWKQMALER